MKLIALLMMAVDLNGQPLPDVVLLDFTAGYCPPCRQMMPVIQEMENTGFPIRKIDITQQPDVSKQYRVDRIPTFILLVEGREVERFQGVTDKGVLVRAMNGAAKKLVEERRRRTPPAKQPPAFPEAAQTATNAAEKEPEAPRPGIRGVFDRMRRGLGGGTAESKTVADPGPAEFRGQSPDHRRTPVDTSRAMLATVRVRLMDGNLRDVGTGTIIHSAAGQSTILTCEHIFQNINQETAAVEVDVFQDGKVLKYPAKVLGGDHESDVAFLQIRNTTPLPTAQLAADITTLEKNETVFSIGCSNGDLPTRLNMNVIEVDRYDGPQNILCTNDPAQGRSGGALFNATNQVVGVCSAADRKAHEGLYTGIKPVRKLIAQLNLNSLFESDVPDFPTATVTPAVADVPPNPLSEDENPFDALIAEETSLAEFTGNTEAVPEPEFSQREMSHPQELPDPFATRPATATAAVAAPTSAPTEITVIINSPDSPNGRRFIVIPRPSPWLMELLTGEKPGAATPGVAIAQEQQLSTTSARASAQKTAR